MIKILILDYQAIQWLRMQLPVQETGIRPLVRENSTRHGATKPVTTTTEPAHLQPVLHNKRSHRNEKPVPH